MAKPLNKRIQKTLDRSAKRLSKVTRDLGKSSSPSKASVAAVAGVAVLGAAGVAAAVHLKRRGNEGTRQFAVRRSSEEGWEVVDKASGEALEHFDTKREALDAARARAAEAAPSTLSIYGMDGTEQASHEYDVASA